MTLNGTHMATSSVTGEYVATVFEIVRDIETRKEFTSTFKLYAVSKSSISFKTYPKWLAARCYHSMLRHDLKPSAVAATVAMYNYVNDILAPDWFYDIVPRPKPRLVVSTDEITVVQNNVPV